MLWKVARCDEGKKGISNLEEAYEIEPEQFATREAFVALSKEIDSYHSADRYLFSQSRPHAHRMRGHDDATQH